MFYVTQFDFKCAYYIRLHFFYKGTMSSNNNSDIVPWLIVGSLIGIAAFAYFTVKSFGEMLGLPWTPAAWLLGGLLLFAVGLIFIGLQGWSYLRLVPCMIPALFLFVVPTLDFMAQGPIHGLLGAAKYRDEYYSNTEVLWYGQLGWQSLIFAVLVVAAFAWNKHLDNRYY